MPKIKNPYYFAYGSNLSLRQMRRRCPHARVIGRAKIKNHEFVITGFSHRWSGGVATIENRRGSEVWGIVYEVDPHCMDRLDIFEGVLHKRYARKEVYCYFANGRKRLVATYIQEPRRLTHTSRAYRRIILHNATHMALPHSYIEDLRQQLSV